jgi:protein gp37
MLTSIAWTDHTLQPGIYGCTEASPGCGRCYAAVMAHRLAGMGQEAYAGLTRKTANGVHWNGIVRVDPERLAVAFDSLPKLRRARVFVTSMSDVFHPDVPTWFQGELFRQMAARPHLTFQVLTKHPAHMATFGQDLLEWPRNVWAGTTIEDQVRADYRAPALLEVPACVRFVSAEPLLGSVNLRPWLKGIQWLIAGCESGPKRRPLDLGWVRDLRDQCAKNGTAFFLKQLVNDAGRVEEVPVLDGVRHHVFPDDRGIPDMARHEDGEHESA